MGKIKVNPSTGKVLVTRDSAGISKLCSTCCVEGLPDPNEMETPVCLFCDPQPLAVRLILTNFVDAGDPGCAIALGTGNAGLYPSGIAGLLNGSHIIHHDSGCIYKKIIPISYTWERHTNDTFCADPTPVDIDVTSLELRVTANAGRASISIALEGDLGQPVFTGEIFLTGPVSCFQGIEGDTVDSTLIGGPCGIDGTLDLATGTAEIEI